MKKAFFLFFTLLSCGFFMISSANGHKYSSLISSPSDIDTTGLMAKLNGKEGVFKTYDDFINNKPLKLKFIKWTYLYTGGTNLKFVKAVFENPEGKKEEMSCDEFWGFRSNDGLYRSFPFENDKVKALGYRLNYIIGGNFVWVIARFNEVSFSPTIHYTQELNGEEQKVDKELKISCATIENALLHRTDWHTKLEKIKSVANLQYLLDQNYDTKGEYTYLKEHPEVHKKYLLMGK